LLFPGLKANTISNTGTITNILGLEQGLTVMLKVREEETQVL
jgi:hypothetical protein